MTEPSGLEYAVRDRDGRIVVAWRTVDEVLHEAEVFGDASVEIELQQGSEEANRAAADAYFASHLRLERLLGLEPAADGVGERNEQREDL